MSSTVSVPVFDKKKHVLLIPDLFPIHMELLANVIRASGYRVEVLRTHGADVMEAGLKYIHNDMCYPAICSLGQQLHAITSGTYDPADVARWGCSSPRPAAAAGPPTTAWCCARP